MLHSLFELIAFVFCLVFCFYLPGRFFLSRLTLRFASLELLFLSSIFGLLLFLVLFYVLSWLHVELLAVLFYVLVDAWALKSRIFPWQQVEKKDLWPAGLIAVGSWLFSTPLTTLGFAGKYVRFGFDDLWHLALIRELAFRFPPNIPTFAGVHLSGYHFFYDFLAAKISQFFAISPFSLHFHLFPVFLALAWGVGVYVLLLLWSKNRVTALIGVFLSMFGGSFAYLYSLTGHPEILQSDGLGIMQPAYSIYNPPFSLSIVVILFSLIALYYYLQDRKMQYLLLIVLAAGMLPMIKVYGAMAFYSGFGLVAVWELRKKKFMPLIALVAVGVLFLLTFGVFVGGQGGLIWFPLWAPIGVLRSFAWYNFDNKIYVYSHEGVIHGLVSTFAYGLFVFLILNLGSRVIGIVLLPLGYVKRARKKIPPSLFAVSVAVMTLTSILIPLFFIQTGKVFEIIQLGFYYLFFCALLAALGFGVVFSFRFKYARLLQIFSFVILFLLTVESSLIIYNGILFHPGQKMLVLDSDYYRALAFLSKEGRYDQTVLELSKQDIGIDLHGVRYWYGISSPEITAFTNKQAFIGLTGIDFKGMDTQRRLADLLTLLQYSKNDTLENRSAARKMLQRNHIRYIFSPYPFDSLLQIRGVKKIYDRGYAIYRV